MLNLLPNNFYLATRSSQKIKRFHSTIEHHKPS